MLKHGFHLEANVAVGKEEADDFVDILDDCTLKLVLHDGVDLFQGPGDIVRLQCPLQAAGFKGTRAVSALSLVVKMRGNAGNGRTINKPVCKCCNPSLLLAGGFIGRGGMHCSLVLGSSAMVSIQGQEGLKRTCLPLCIIYG